MLRYFLLLGVIQLCLEVLKIIDSETIFELALITPNVFAKSFAQLVCLLV